jgi:phosphoribosylcarboxyaminoimidazole (NCAIR) mutase
MPKGVPVATFAIGAAGAANAALFAVALLANENPALRQKLEAFPRGADRSRPRHGRCRRWRAFGMSGPRP